MKRIGIMQPTFFPWAGYFELLNYVDEFVFLDDVEVSKQSWQTRNIFNISGSVKWISVPVLGSSKLRLCDVPLNKVEFFLKKLRKSLVQANAKSKYIDTIHEMFLRIESEDCRTLAELNMTIIKIYCDFLNISTPLHRSSEMEIFETRDKKVINIVNILQGTDYIATPGAREYMEKFGLNNYPFDVHYFDYQKSLSCTRLYEGFGMENILELCARVDLPEIQSVILS